MELLRFWRRPGSDGPHIDFLLTSGNRAIFDDEARHLGAELHYLPYRRATLGNFFIKFRRILKKGKYDAIHDHSDLASGWHFLMSGGRSSVRVTHVHNAWTSIRENYAVTLPRQITTVLGRNLVRSLATHICGTSEQVLREYGFPPKWTGYPKSSVVHCGFDVTRFNAPREDDRASVLREFLWPEESKIVLFAGRLDPIGSPNQICNQKNSWFALNVLRAAVEKRSSVRMLMAGTGSSRQELERHIEGWGLKDKLRVIGIRMDIARLMRAADVLIFPSRHEGLGMVAVEAQAAGLPVLASSVVPKECVVMPELFSAIPLDSSIEHWTTALLQMMSKPRPSLELCRRAFDCSAFSISNSAKRLEEIYRETQR